MFLSINAIYGLSESYYHYTRGNQHIFIFGDDHFLGTNANERDELDTFAESVKAMTKNGKKVCIIYEGLSNRAESARSLREKLMYHTILPHASECRDPAADLTRLFSMMHCINYHPVIKKAAAEGIVELCDADPEERARLIGDMTVMASRTIYDSSNILDLFVRNGFVMAKINQYRETYYTREREALQKITPAIQLPSCDQVPLEYMCGALSLKNTQEGKLTYKEIVCKIEDYLTRSQIFFEANCRDAKSIREDIKLTLQELTENIKIPGSSKSPKKDSPADYYNQLSQSMPKLLQELSGTSVYDLIEKKCYIMNLPVLNLFGTAELLETVLSQYDLIGEKENIKKMSIADILRTYDNTPFGELIYDTILQDIAGFGIIMNFYFNPFSNYVVATNLLDFEAIKLIVQHPEPNIILVVGDAHLNPDRTTLPPNCTRGILHYLRELGYNQVEELPPSKGLELIKSKITEMPIRILLPQF